MVLVHLHGQQGVEHGVASLLQHLGVQSTQVTGTEAGEIAHRVRTEAGRQDLLLAQLLFGLLTSLFPFGFKEDLAHLGCPLAEGLAGLFAGGIIADLKPQAGLLIAFQEPSVVLSDGSDDGARDGGLIVLAGLEVRAAVQVDEIPEVTVSGVHVGASATAAQDVIVVKVGESLLAGRNGSGAWSIAVGVQPRHVARVEVGTTRGVSVVGFGLDLLRGTSRRVFTSFALFGLLGAIDVVAFVRRGGVVASQHMHYGTLSGILRCKGEVVLSSHSVVVAVHVVTIVIAVVDVVAIVSVGVVVVGSSGRAHEKGVGPKGVEQRQARFFRPHVRQVPKPVWTAKTTAVVSHRGGIDALILLLLLVLLLLLLLLVLLLLVLLLLLLLLMLDLLLLIPNLLLEVFLLFPELLQLLLLVLELVLLMLLLAVVLGVHRGDYGSSPLCLDHHACGTAVVAGTGTGAAGIVVHRL